MRQCSRDVPLLLLEKALPQMLSLADGISVEPKAEGRRLCEMLSFRPLAILL